MSKSIPITTVILVCVMLVVGTVLAIFSDPTKSAGTSVILGLVATSIPGLIASGYAERASRDIRNGTVIAKAKEGATQALIETGVREVAQTALQTVPVTLAALQHLLETNTAATQTNTNALQASAVPTEHTVADEMKGG